MKRLLALVVGLFMLAGCAAVSKAPVQEETKYAPFVMLNRMDCSAIEYKIGEWVDENDDGIMQNDEWYVYVIDTLEPMGRKEYKLPHGFYLIKIVVAKKDGNTISGWAAGEIPAPDLAPHEKTTLVVSCGHDKHMENVRYDYRFKV